MWVNTRGRQGDGKQIDIHDNTTLPKRKKKELQGSNTLNYVWLYLLIMSRTRFRVNPHSIVAWMSRNSLLEAGPKSEVLSDWNWTRTQNHLVRNRALNHLAKLTKWLSVRFRTNWFWVRVQLQSLISVCFIIFLMSLSSCF